MNTTKTVSIHVASPRAAAGVVLLTVHFQLYWLRFFRPEPTCVRAVGLHLEANFCSVSWNDQLPLVWVCNYECAVLVEGSCCHVHLRPVPTAQGHRFSSIQDDRRVLEDQIPVCQHI